MERELTRKLAAAAIAVAVAALALMAALLAAPAALAAPHVSLLDADGEAAEHRAITIGSEAKAYRGELKGADSAARSWRWTAEPQGLVSIDDASSQEASIAGIAEGSATVTVTATLPDGTELSDSMLLTSYTWLPRAYPASVSAPGGAALTRGATGDASRDYVRCTAPAGQAMEVVGTCGEGFFRVRLPEGFEFADPDGHASNRNAFCRRSALAVSAASVKLDREGSLRLFEGDSARLSVAVDPPFATDALSWSSSDPSVASAGGGRVAAGKAGKAVVTASCGGASASVAVEVSPLVTVTEPHVSKRGRTWVSLAWEPCTRASSYSVQAYLGGAWSEVGSAPGTSFKVKGLQAGRKYSFRVVPRGASGTIGKASSPKNKCRARTEGPAVSVGKAPSKKKAPKKKASKRKAGRASAVSRTQRHIMRTGTYSFPNWSGRAKWVSCDLDRLVKVLSQDGNLLGKNGGSLKGKELKKLLRTFRSDGYCEGLASSAFLDCYGTVDVRNHVKQRHKKSINGLKRSKRLDSLISYYQVLQYDTVVAGKYNESRLRKLGKYKPLSNNKKLKKLVKRAWDGKLQVLHLSWVIDFRRDGHAVLLLPFVKDKMAKKGYYELRAYDPDSPGKMIKIRIKRNGEVSVPSYFKHMRENPIDIVQFATRDWPWVSRNINGK